MLMEIVEVFTDMVNCSLFPEAYEQLTEVRRKKLGEWVVFEESLADSLGAWLPQIVREIRYYIRNTCISLHFYASVICIAVFCVTIIHSSVILSVGCVWDHCRSCLFQPRLWT